MKGTQGELLPMPMASLAPIAVYETADDEIGPGAGAGLLLPLPQPVSRATTPAMAMRGVHFAGPTGLVTRVIRMTTEVRDTLNV